MAQEDSTSTPGPEHEWCRRQVEFTQTQLVSAGISCDVYWHIDGRVIVLFSWPGAEALDTRVNLWPPGAECQLPTGKLTFGASGWREQWVEGFVPCPESFDVVRGKILAFRTVVDGLRAEIFREKAGPWSGDFRAALTGLATAGCSPEELVTRAGDIADAAARLRARPVASPPQEK